MFLVEKWKQPYSSKSGRRLVDCYNLWEVQPDKKSIKKQLLYIDWPFDKDELEWETTTTLTAPYADGSRIRKNTHQKLLPLDCLPERAKMLLEL